MKGPFGRDFLATKPKEDSNVPNGPREAYDELA
jgi:hypothetical protein